MALGDAPARSALIDTAIARARRPGRLPATRPRPHLTSRSQAGRGRRRGVPHASVHSDRGLMITGLVPSSRTGCMSGFCVNDLVTSRQLSCTVLAGSGGLGRRVLWAHACELDDPWNWVGADELLMTVGFCIPPVEAEQVRLVRNLADAGLAGLAVGDDLKAPPITRAMLAEADSHDFPVLLVGHTTPFAAIGRTVAIASQSEQISRITRLSRLYELARTADAGEESALTRLAAELGRPLHVVDVAYRSEVLRTGAGLDPDVIDALADQVADQLDRLPARTVIRRSTPPADGAVASAPGRGAEEPDSTGRPRGADLVATAFALPTHRRCMLVVEGPGAVDFDVLVLLHAQNLIAIDVEKSTREREHADETGAELFRQIVDESVGADAARMSMDHRGLAADSYTVLAFAGEHLPTARLLIGDAHIPGLSMAAGSQGFLLVADDQAKAAILLLEGRIPAIGRSGSTSALQHLSDSTRQAAWALQAAEAGGGGVADYTTAAPLFLPRTLADAHFAARAILGPLLDYDEQHRTDLVETLKIFLRADRNWNAAAAELHIHRQTLGYRLRRIESLTGRSIRSTADTALFWMALMAHAITTATS